MSIRGTLSLSDVATDFLIRPAPLHEAELQEVAQLLESVGGSPRCGGGPGLEGRVSVHSGMRQVARSIIADLNKQGALECLEPKCV